MDRAELIYKLQQLKGVSQAHTMELRSLEHRMQELEDYVHLVMRGPKGDRGADGVDGADCDLTEEDIKSAVRDGVVEGLQEFVEGLKSQDARRF